MKEMHKKFRYILIVAWLTPAVADLLVPDGDFELIEFKGNCPFLFKE